MELCARLQGLAYDGRAADISRLQCRVSQAASKLRMTGFVPSLHLYTRDQVTAVGRQINWGTNLVQLLKK